MEIKSLPKVLYIEDMYDSRALVRRLLEGRYVVLESGDPMIPSRIWFFWISTCRI
jgi:hypothetical protein